AIVEKETHLSFILARFDVDWWEDTMYICFFLDELHDHVIPSIQISLQFQDWEEWNKPWSMSSFANEFEENIRRLNNNKFEYYQEEPDSMLNGFGVTYCPLNGNSIIKTEVDYLFTVIEEQLLQTNKNLLESLNEEAVLTYFQFPDEVKTACKQYLVYFAQFIADLGIIVDTEIKEELHHTLFKVIPSNKEEGLDKIKEALNIYLNAPNDNSFHIQAINQTDIAIRQWEANIFHLKSQLSLAGSIIQAKDATIQMLQLSNYQYKQLLESHSAKKETDKEEIIRGILSVNKFEGKGFTIDIAEIFRRLKRIIKK
ncbi:MAG TPA: hypothetical protein VK796_07925, partial [Cytophaga sp.]|nr:hypothetical protein [Cytophaga sp.]